jgi:hypothetical protein
MSVFLKTNPNSQTNKIALKKEGILIPRCLAIKRSIQVSLCSAEIIPNSIPKTIAITIAKKASIAVLGKVFPIISIFHFSETFSKIRSLND